MLASTHYIHRWWLVTVPRVVGLGMWPSIILNIHWEHSLTTVLWTLWTQEHRVNVLGRRLPASSSGPQYQQTSIDEIFVSTSFLTSSFSVFYSPRAHWTIGHQTLGMHTEVGNWGENLRYDPQAQATEQEGVLCHGLLGPLCLWTLTQIINMFFGEQSQLHTDFGNVNHSRSWGYWSTWTSDLSNISYFRGFYHTLFLEQRCW